MVYVVNGHQLAGHTILAVPVEYGVTGASTFIVAENGIVMEADLGSDTLEAALENYAYNPGPDWRVAE